MIPPHLLLAYDFPPIGGGIARWMGELALRYPPGGLIVSTGRHPGARDTDSLFPNRIDRLPVPSGRLRTIPGLLAWSRRAASLARTTGASFVWCGNVKPAGYPAKWTLERVGTPYGILVHGADLLILRHQAHRSRLKRSTARALLGSAGVIVANSTWTRELALSVIREVDAPVPPNRVRAVPLGADPGAFRPGLDTAIVRARYQLGPGRWMITVARLVPHKGIDIGLQVLERLAGEVPELRYAVVGSGDQHAELEALARRLGVADRVRFLTGVPDTDLPALLNVAELYLGASRREEKSVEGFGIALAEASASGLPVVGGRSGGMPDAVLDGKTGLLVDAEDAGAVTAAVRRLLNDHDLARRLGAGGRAAVERYFNWSRVVSDLRGIADEVIAEGVRRPVAR